MPTHREHRKIAKAYVGRAMPAVDRLLDFPPGGLGHREIHDWRGVLLALTVYGPDGGRAAVAHILADAKMDLFHGMLRELGVRSPLNAHKR